MKHVILTTLLLVSLAAAQSRQLGGSPETDQKPCALLSFDKELRDAVSTADVARIALFVDYPLRVNDEGGSFYIYDAASLHGHFSEIFTSAVRKAILRQRLDTEYCGANRVVYGLGEAVVNLYGSGYRIGSINISIRKPDKTLVGRVEFVCRTDLSRMVVDDQANGTPRLRAWNTGTLLAQKPDMELRGGKKEVEGTEPCTRTSWTFQSGKNEFSLSEGGCYPDSNQPPGGALGQFAKHTGQQEESWSWCY